MTMLDCGKAYYSLDCEDGIENCAFDFTAKSPEEILVEREEEQVYLATLELLAEAMGNLTEIQARRIHARYILGKKLIEIAAEEGVSVSRTRQTLPTQGFMTAYWNGVRRFSFPVRTSGRKEPGRPKRRRRRL